MVNDIAPNESARIPDPNRLLAAYHQASSTLNLLRAFTKGGYADLTRVHTWNQEFVASSKEGQRYERLADEIDRALRFMPPAGSTPRPPPTSTRWTSTPPTRRWCSATRRRSPVVIRSPATGTTARPT
jgi:3-deoxy-D-arabino-heptulosonate 7-phosphate (DAHP) synthase class II